MYSWFLFALLQQSGLIINLLHYYVKMETDDKVKNISIKSASLSSGDKLFRNDTNDGNKSFSVTLAWIIFKLRHDLQAVPCIPMDDIQKASDLQKRISSFLDNDITLFMDDSVNVLHKHRSRIIQATLTFKPYLLLVFNSQGYSSLKLFRMYLEKTKKKNWLFISN